MGEWLDRIAVGDEVAAEWEGSLRLLRVTGTTQSTILVDGDWTFARTDGRGLDPPRGTPNKERWLVLLSPEEMRRLRDRDAQARAERERQAALPPLRAGWREQCR